MSSTTYTVKSGDTLSGIAKNYGVGLDSISGYKSGDPNKIGVGETLTIGAPADKSAATSYASTVKDALGGGTGSSSGTTGTTDDFLTGLRTKITDAQKTVSDAATKLANLKTTTYDQAYKDAGLDTIKGKIADLDTTIAQKKADRDAAIAKVRSNPGLSAALLTGTVGKLSDKANAEINDLIQQRNGYAGDYNTRLTKVGQVVDNVVGDASTQYNAAVKALDSLTGQAKDYQSNLLDALKTSNTKDYQDQSLAIALMNAQANAERAGKYGGGTTPSWKLATSPLTGAPLYWYDNEGNTRALTATEKQSLSGGGAPDTSGSQPAPDNSVDTSTSLPWYKKIANFFWAHY